MQTDLLVPRGLPSHQCCLEYLVYPGNNHSHEFSEASVSHLYNYRK